MRVSTMTGGESVAILRGRRVVFASHYFYPKPMEEHYPQGRIQ